MLLTQKRKYNMNKRQVKPGDWVKVSDKETHKTYKGKYG